MGDVNISSELKSKVAKIKKDYALFKFQVEQLLKSVETLGEFYIKLKRDSKIMELKKKVRDELQDLYRLLAVKFGLKRIPVYISDRYKIKKRGSSYFKESNPKGIVLFYLLSTEFVEFSKPVPDGFRVVSDEEILETFAHEVAHVLDMKMRGKTFHDGRFWDLVDKIAIMIFTGKEPN